MHAVGIKTVPDRRESGANAIVLTEMKDRLSKSRNAFKNTVRTYPLTYPPAHVASTQLIAGSDPNNKENLPSIAQLAEQAIGSCNQAFDTVDFRLRLAYLVSIFSITGQSTYWIYKRRTVYTGLKKGLIKKANDSKFWDFINDQLKVARTHAPTGPAFKT
jgi:hypothetical protein